MHAPSFPKTTASGFALYASRPMNISSKTRNKKLRRNKYFSGKNHVKMWKNTHNGFKVGKIYLQLTHENMRNQKNLTMPCASISLNRFSEFEFFVIFSLIFNFFRMSTYYLGALKHMENSCDYVFGHENKNKKILQSSWHKA